MSCRDSERQMKRHRDRYTHMPVSLCEQKQLLQQTPKTNRTPLTRIQLLDHPFHLNAPNWDAKAVPRSTTAVSSVAVRVHTCVE